MTAVGVVGAVELGRWRLHAQGADRPSGGPADVVARMLAMQAQDYGQGTWAVGLRCARGTLAQVEAALAEASVVRTWPMRGTIHFCSPRDVRWLLKLCAARKLSTDARRMRELELTEADVLAARDALTTALTASPILTRASMMKVLADAGISPEGQRGYHVLWSLSQRGVLCFGPMQGKEQTFTLLDGWVPPSELDDLDGDDALAELALRYTCSHGPATDRDLAVWAGITLTSARRGLAAAGDALATLEVDGVSYWVDAALPDAMAGGGKAGPVLLPGFDEYLLGYSERSAVLAAEHADRIVPGGNGVFRPMVVVDGAILGTWQRKATARGVKVDLTPFAGTAFPKSATRALQREAQRYADFLGVPLLSP